MIISSSYLTDVSCVVLSQYENRFVYCAQVVLRDVNILL